MIVTLFFVFLLVPLKHFKPNDACHVHFPYNVKHGNNGDTRLEYEYDEIEYKKDFSILAWRLHIIKSHASSQELPSSTENNIKNAGGL